MDEWKEFFENFAYKPNWRFDLEDWGHELRLRIQMRVPNSRVSDESGVHPPTLVSKAVLLDSWMGEEYAKNYTRAVIQNMENHEIDEWFRYKGELPFDPHEVY